MLRKNKVSEKALEFFNNEYLHMIDKFQKTMDQSHLLRDSCFRKNLNVKNIKQLFGKVYKILLNKQN